MTAIASVVPLAWDERKHLRRAIRTLYVDRDAVNFRDRLVGPRPDAGLRELQLPFACIPKLGGARSMRSSRPYFTSATYSRVNVSALTLK